ncbi:MAG: AraC family transcriptional regulator [Victivallaceae bacterium]
MILHDMVIDAATLKALSGLHCSFLSGWSVPVQPGSCPFHRHRGFEIVYHRGVRGTVYADDGKQIDFVPGSWVIHPPGQAHFQTSHTSGKDLCIHLAVNGALPEPLRVMRYINNTTDKSMAADLAFLLKPVPRMNSLQQAVYDHRGTALLLALLEQSLQPASSSEAIGSSQWYAAEACRIILNEFNTLRKTQDIAARIGISDHYLRHIFKDRYQTGIKDFIIFTRLARAENLLENSTLPLKAIAGDCGFASERHLCTVFKKIRGLSPGAFRANASG